MSIIDLLAILPKCLDRAIFLYNFIREAPLSGVGATFENATTNCNEIPFDPHSFSE